jgi:threonine-phosphate decarboxylase
MSSNVNPLGPPPGLVEHLKQQLTAIEALPQADAKAINESFAKRYDIAPEKTLAGNGTTQFIYAIPKVLNSRNTLILGPTYSDYAGCLQNARCAFVFAMAHDSNGFHHDIVQVEKQLHQFDTVFICNPNNPTGVLISGDIIKNLCRKYPIYFLLLMNPIFHLFPAANQSL